MDVKTGVVEVEIREDDVQERFCTLQLRLKSFDVLRRRIATTIGRLIVCALVTIDSAMGARLLAVAFDFLPPTLVARTRYPTALLHGCHRGLLDALIRLIVIAR
jgi:hypothetical protein